jgi:hypothetical protein
MKRLLNELRVDVATDERSIYATSHQETRHFGMGLINMIDDARDQMLK